MQIEYVDIYNIKTNNNRPVAFGLFVTIFVMLIIFWAHMCFGIILKYVNLSHNKKLWESNPITTLIGNQHLYKDYKIGLGDIADNGCGVTAVFDILYLENKPTPLYEIISFFECSYLNAYGFGGTDPFGIKHYLHKQGFNVKFHTNQSKFENIAINSKYVIFCYVTPDYAHYQLMHDYDGSTFQLINITVRWSFEQFLQSIDDAFLKFMISVNV